MRTDTNPSRRKPRQESLHPGAAMAPGAASGASRGGAEVTAVGSTVSAEIRDSGLLFEQALGQARMAVCITDPNLADNPIIYANEAFLDLTGYRMGDVLSRNCRFLQGPDTDASSVERLRQAVRDQVAVVVELLNYRRNGEAFWNALHIGPVFGPDGELKYYFGSQMDVTDVHNAAIPSDRGELSRHIRNMLGAVRGVFTPRREADPAPRGGHVSWREVATHILSAYPATFRARLVVDGPSIDVAEDSVGVLGLCVHELASRAMRGTGDVELLWSRDAPGWMRLDWREEGARQDAAQGAPEDAIEAMPMLDTLMDSLGGSWSLQRGEGATVTTLRLPIDPPTGGAPGDGPGGP